MHSAQCWRNPLVDALLCPPEGSSCAFLTLAPPALSSLSLPRGPVGSDVGEGHLCTNPVVSKPDVVVSAQLTESFPLTC